MGSLVARVALSTTGLLSIALFYWAGLVLEAFQLSIDWLLVCRTTTAGWFVSAVVIWHQLDRPSPHETHSESSQRVHWATNTLACILIAFDVWLLTMGLISLTPWSLVPLLHGVGCYVLLFNKDERFHS